MTVAKSSKGDKDTGYQLARATWLLQLLAERAQSTEDGYRIEITGQIYDTIAEFLEGRAGELEPCRPINRP